MNIKYIISFVYIIGTTAVIALGSAGLLHHGWANYDQETELEFTGTIQEGSIENPHSYIELEVDGGQEEADVEESVWLVILAPASRMTNRGITVEMIATGSEVTVHGHPHRTTDYEMRAESITIGDMTVGLRR